jgi:flagellar motor switch protein FliG
MSIYWRYKQSPDGFRKLVELLETTPMSRRQKMIDAGLAEDSRYTHQALQYVMEFKDIVGLPDSELAEVLARAPGRIVAYALSGLDESDRSRFLKCTPPKLMGEVKDFLDANPISTDISGARYKLITIARDLERKGLVKTKAIPNAA